MTIETKNSKVPKLRFREFSDEWQTKSLKGLLSLTIDNRGKTPPVATEGIPLIEANALGDKTVKYTLIKKFVDEKTYQSWFRQHIQNGDTLFSTVGATALCSLYDGAKATIAQNIVGLRADNGVDSNFLYYLLVEPKNNHQFKKIEMTAVQPSVKVSQMIHLKFTLPMKSEQKKIAEFLMAVDEKIEKLQKKKELLEKYKKGVMQKIFSQQIRFKNESGKDFPDWEEKKLGDLNIYVSDGNYGEMYPKASEMEVGGVPFIRANNIKNGRLTWDDMKFISPKLHNVLKSGHLKENDILITTRGEIGMLAFVTNEFIDANINAQICLLRADNVIDSKYLFQYLSTRKGKSQFLQLQTGSALKQLPKAKLALVQISLPIKEEQQKIAEFLTSLDDKIKLEESKLEQAKQFKKALLQQMFV